MFRYHVNYGNGQVFAFQTEREATAHMVWMHRVSGGKYVGRVTVVA